MEYKYIVVTLGLIFIVYLLVNKKIMEIDKSDKQQTTYYKILKIGKTILNTLYVIAGTYFIGYTIKVLFID